MPTFTLYLLRCLPVDSTAFEHKLTLPPQIHGNAYSTDRIAQANSSGQIHSLARNLTEATDRLEQSDMAREYLGGDFIEHFVTTHRWEVREFEKAVTNWERRRYLELI